MQQVNNGMISEESTFLSTDAKEFDNLVGDKSNDREESKDITSDFESITDQESLIEKDSNQTEYECYSTEETSYTAESDVDKTPSVVNGESDQSTEVEEEKTIVKENGIQDSELTGVKERISENHVRDADNGFTGTNFAESMNGLPDLNLKENGDDVQNDIEKLFPVVQGPDRKAIVSFAEDTTDRTNERAAYRIGRRKRELGKNENNIQRDATFVTSKDRKVSPNAAEPNSMTSSNMASSHDTAPFDQQMSEIDRQNAAINAIINQQQEDILEQTRRTKEIINAVRRNIRGTIHTRRQEQRLQSHVIKGGGGGAGKQSVLARQNVRLANVNLNDISCDLPAHQVSRSNGGVMMPRNGGGVLPTKRRAKM